MRPGSFSNCHYIFSHDSDLTTSVVHPSVCTSVRDHNPIQLFNQSTFSSIDFLINQLSHQLSFSTIDFLINRLPHQSTLFIFSSTYRNFLDFLSCWISWNIVTQSTQFSYFILLLQSFFRRTCSTEIPSMNEDTGF